MWVTLHAITLALLPVLTIAAVAKSPARPRLTEIAVAALFGAAVFMILAPSFSTCCDEPLQWRQLLIPTACATTAIVFVRRKELSLAIALASLMLAFLLAFHFAALLGTGGWTGKRNLAQQSEGMAHRRLSDIQSELRSVQDDTSYPPCWLRDHPIREFAITGAVKPPRDSWSEPAWHSWLTGLYRRHDLDRDFWYPGGTPAEAADRIELRPRPDLWDRLAQVDAGRQAQVDEHMANSEIFADAVTFADFLAEYALRNDGRLPDSLAQLATGTIRREPDGRLIEARTSKQVVNPDQFSWPRGARVEPLPVPQSQPATRSSDPAARHLMQVTGRNMSESLLNQLDTRIRWIRFNGHVPSVE